MSAVDLFAGPGGWDVAANDLGIHTIGVEMDHLSLGEKPMNQTWHTSSMPNRSSSPSLRGADLNQLAAALVAKATSEGKNPAAVLLGRMGGLKGGKARAKALTKTERSEIARKAARARWGEKGA